MIRTLTLLPLLALALGATIQFDNRIIGGQAVDIKDYSYQVSLIMNGRHECGGSIIGSTFILTAAHCTLGSRPKDIQIRAGSTIHNNGGKIYNVLNINEHPKYNPDTFENDFSILELTEDIQFSDTVGIIATAKVEPKVGDIATVSGWGLTQEVGDNGPNELQAVQVAMLDRNVCNKAYKNVRWNVTESMVCAGDLENGGKDACRMDSGGPLVVNHQLAGVVSWGIGCGRPNSPGVYSNVASAKRFIASVTGIW